jgi:glycosyltransferase involved in cell wall biosynthesis
MKEQKITAPPVVSVVAACYNEADNLPEFVRRIGLAMRQVPEPWELILVDDGSIDHSWRVIEQLRAENPQLIGLRLSRNFSHQNALIAGLAHARGRAIVSLDSDLQHPPELIPEMIDAWREGWRVVMTCRREGGETSTFKRLTSRYFYKAFSFMTDISMGSGASDFRLLDRKALSVLLRFAGTDRFLRGSVNWMGFPSKSLHYQVGERAAGTSAYNLARMVSFSVTAMTSFSMKPLRIGLWIAGIVGLFAIAELFYVLYIAMSGAGVPGWASVAGLISFLFAMHFAVLGIFGLYISRIYSVLQSRPVFIIDEYTGVANAESDVAPLAAGSPIMAHIDSPGPPHG